MLGRKSKVFGNARVGTLFVRVPWCISMHLLVIGYGSHVIVVWPGLPLGDLDCGCDVKRYPVLIQVSQPWLTHITEKLSSILPSIFLGWIILPSDQKLRLIVHHLVADHVVNNPFWFLLLGVLEGVRIV